LKKGDPVAGEDELILGPSTAARALWTTFGPILDADYLSGKTLFRDALCDRFDVSLLEAEELCDELERANRIIFVQTESAAGWHVHEPEEQA
jgi:hypothetical protein